MEQAPSKPEASTESLAEELDRLKRKKRRLELEHELKLLEIEEKIAAIERKVQS